MSPPSSIRTDGSAYWDLLDELDLEDGVSLVTWDTGGPVKVRKWQARQRGDGHSYRTVYQNEVVFDIGDHGDWQKCVQDTIALWGRLERLGHIPGVDYWPALSGGKGTHTHLFIEKTATLTRKWDDREDSRENFAKMLCAARMGQPSIEYDPRLINPSFQGRMVREFGARGRMGFLKTMWPHRYDSLPGDRQKAYQMVGPARFPSGVTPLLSPMGHLHREIRTAFGGVCPKRRECVLDPICNDCPAAR